MSLTAHEVFDLEQSIPRIVQRINFILHPHENNATDFIAKFREMIDIEYGSTRVNLSFIIDNQIVETETAQSLTFTITGTNYKELRRHPALAGVRIQSVEVQPIDDRKPWEKRKKKF